MLITRREAFAGSIGAALFAASASYAQDAAVVETRSGKVSGLAAANGARAFLGIPYAASTEGAGRFRPPSPAKAWPGVLQATAFGARSPQLPRERDPELPTRGPDRMGDDCLALNVWTPALRDGRKRPVMVWFHGGGFNTGTGNMDGSRLAMNGDVVVVSVNHRLNAFGFLYLAELGGPDFAESGNAGLLDCVQSLRWVRDNIAEFGGDPGNVTIFGISGGGGKVSVLCGMPQAKGLFHRAIIQSGSHLTGIEPAKATESAAALMTALGLKTNEVRRLQEVPWPTLVREGYAKVMVVREPYNVHSYSPVADGKALPRSPWLNAGPPESAHIPMLVGTCRTETTRLHGGPDRDPSVFAVDAVSIIPKLKRWVPDDAAAQVVADFKRMNPTATYPEIYFDITTNRRYRQQSWIQVAAKAEQAAAPVYEYELQWTSPLDGGKWGTPHGLDGGFIFDRVRNNPLYGDGPDARAMVKQMTAAWCAFARTGNPNIGVMPTWEPVGATASRTMLLNTQSAMASDWRGDQKAVLGRLPVLIMAR